MEKLKSYISALIEAVFKKKNSYIANLIAFCRKLFSMFGEVAYV